MRPEGCLEASAGSVDDSGSVLVSTKLKGGASD